MIDETVVKRVLDASLTHGGDFAELFAEDRGSAGARLDAGRVEQVDSSRERGVGIRVVSGDSTGFAYTSDFSEAALLATARAAAAALANSSAGGSVAVSAAAGRVRPDTAVYGGQAMDRGASELASSGLPGARIPPESVPKADKVALLLVADEAARSAGGAVRQVSAIYHDSRRRVLVATSDGVRSIDDQVRTRFAVTCTASGDTGMQTGYDVLARTVGFELLEGDEVAELSRRAAHRALSKLEARPAPAGTATVVLAKGSGGILFHEACGHGLEADHIVKGASVFTGALGKKVASPLVTLVDDGTVAGEWGAYAIDDEGHAGRRNVLIEDGVLVGYLWDRLRAGHSGRAESSGNGRRQSYRHLPMVRMTNTFLIPGSGDPDALVADTRSGVYVAQLGGGQVNTATGDFVFGMTEAYLIENGQLTTPLRDANLIGNGPDVLQRIDAVACDFAMTPGTCGKDGQQVPVGCGQPTLRIAGVTIGGTAGA